MENQDPVDLAKIRHDINGALSVINGLLARLDLPEDYREAHAAALRSVKKIEAIVNGKG